MADNKYVLIFFNRGEDEISMTASIEKDLKVSYDNYSMRDAIEHQDLGIFTNDRVKAVNIKKHGVKVFIFKFFKNGLRQEDD